MHATELADAQTLWTAGLAELSLETTVPCGTSTGSIQLLGHGADKASYQCHSALRADDQSQLARLQDRQESPWLLPFTDMFSKRRQFAVDGFGRIHLIIGEP